MLCPEALLLQYVNPMAMLGWAVSRASSISTLGLCHSVQGTAGELEQDLGLPPGGLEYVCAGINHLSFYLELVHSGRDMYPELLAKEDIPEWNRVRYEVLHHFGYFCTESSEHLAEYVPWFIKQARPELVGTFNVPLDEYPRRCELQIAEWEELRHSLENGVAPATARSNEYGARIVHALETGEPFTFNANVMNDGTDRQPPGVLRRGALYRRRERRLATARRCPAAAARRVDPDQRQRPGLDRRGSSDRQTGARLPRSHARIHTPPRSSRSGRSTSWSIASWRPTASLSRFSVRRGPCPARDNAVVQKYVLSELDSGERVISERVPSVRSVAIGFWIGAGSRDETDAKAGVSHFIEHLLFKGSRAYTAQQIAEIFDGLGGELNAATSREHTMVYARVPDAQVQTALNVMTDMVFAPGFTDLDSEREVVLEEIAMYEDTPQELVHDLFSEAVFGRHALGRPVIGTADVISSVTKRVLSTYHRQMYAGGNVVIAAAGNVEHNKFIRMLARAQSQQRPPAGGPRVRRPLVKAPPPDFRFAKKDTEQYHVCVGAPGIARSDPRRFAASILDSILGGSASSRLFQEIREKRGMAYSVYSFASQYTDTGLVGIYVGTREENLGPCVEIASEQLLDIAHGNVRPEEIARAKENLKGRIMLSMESTSNRMTRLGKSLITDTELLSFERIIAEIEAVEPEEVAELAEHLFAPEKLSISGIGPSERVFRAAARRINPAVLVRAA